jgi:hypothetical protein
MVGPGQRPRTFEDKNAGRQGCSRKYRRKHVRSGNLQQRGDTLMLGSLAIASLPIELLADSKTGVLH